MDAAAAKTSKYEGLEIKLSKIKHKEKEDSKKIKSASVSCKITSSSPTYV